MNERISVFIGLGTNRGDREENLRRALEHIQTFIDIERSSSVYETEPVGYEDQNWFLNMVVKGTTNLPVNDLLARLQAIENTMGRERSIKNGPRIIDLDILFYSDTICATDSLTIPHPEIQNRGFVLAPLHEIAPGFIHPAFKKDITTLFKGLNRKKEVKKWTKTK